MLKTNKKGFTLVETIISITIIILAAAAILPLILYSSQSTYSNQNLITANNLASSVMEEIRSLDFDSIGTVDGNPEGLIEKEQKRTLNGYDYSIYTNISWTSAFHKEGVNPLAYKNISIIVKGVDVHTSTEKELAQLNSIATRGGEEPLIEEGHLKVRILDTDYSPVYENISVKIDRDEGPIQIQHVDYSGQALFGKLEQGSYKVTVNLPDGMFGIGGDVYDPESNTIVKENVYVANYATTEIIFIVDYKENASGIALQFIDEKKDNPIDNPIQRDGAISIDLNLNGSNYTISKQFRGEDFKDGALSKEFLGSLPSGTKISEIRVYGISGYKNYVMSESESKPRLIGEEDPWNCIIPEKDTVETVLIPLESGYLYEERTKKDFESCHDMSVTLYVNEDDNLSLKEYKAKIDNDEFQAKVDPKSEHGNKDKRIGNAFDGKKNTYWQINNHQYDNSIEIIFNEMKTISELKVYADQHGPAGYAMEFYVNGNDWVGKASGKFDGEWGNEVSSKTAVLDEPISCTKITLIFNPISSSNFRIHEIELRSASKDGYADEGDRIVGPLDLSIYEIAPYFRVYWEVEEPPGTSFEVRALLLDDGIEPNVSDFTEGTRIEKSGDTIHVISWGQSLKGKSLWILEKFSSNEENNESPVLKHLYIDADIND